MIEIVKNIREKGFNPIVITPNYGKVNDVLNELNIKNYTFEFYCWTCSDNISNFKKFVLKQRYKIINYITILRIIKKFKKTNINLIHSNSSVIDIGAKVAKKLKRKHIWHLREFGNEDYNIQFFVSRKNAIEYILNNSNTIICISNSIKEAYFKKEEYKNVKVIYNAVDYKKVEKVVLNNKKIKIILAGTIIRSKNQLEVVQAYNLLDENIKRDIFIDIVGDGDPKYICEIKTIINKNKLNNIRLLGYVDNIKYLYKDYDLGIVSSKKEAFGRVTVEYMINGIVPIVSDSGANCEIVEHGENGFVYNLGDIYQLANIIKELYYDRKKILEISKNASDFAKLNFSINKLIDNLINLYKNLI